MHNLNTHLNTKPSREEDSSWKHLAAMASNLVARNNALNLNGKQLYTTFDVCDQTLI